MVKKWIKAISPWAMIIGALGWGLLLFGIDIAETIGGFGTTVSAVFFGIMLVVGGFALLEELGVM